MKFKKIILIFLILLAVFTIATVSAADSNATSDTLTLDDNDNIIFNSQDGELKSSDTDKSIIGSDNADEPIIRDPTPKSDPSVIISVNNTEIENTVKINIVTGNDEATSDQIDVSVNGEKQDVYGSAGVFNVVTSRMLVADDYTVNVGVSETESFNSAFNSTSFVVFKHASKIDSLNLTPEVVIEHNVTISVQMGSVSGFAVNSSMVIVEVDGLKYSVPVDEDGRGILSFEQYAIGVHDVMAYFMGDAYYNSSEIANGSFTVIDKNDTIVNISVSDSEIENDVIINIMTNNADLTSDKVVVFVKGVEQTVSGSKGNFTVILHNVTVAGNYMVAVGVNSTEWFKSGGDVAVFNVFKHASMIKPLVISPDEIIVVGHNVTITVEMENIKGFTANCTNATVRVADKEYPVELDSKGVGTLTLYLPIGNYTATASFEGNDYYNESMEMHKWFGVIDKNTTLVDVSANNTEIENPVHISIVVNNAELTLDNITVLINGIEVDKSLIIRDGEDPKFSVIIPPENVTFAGNCTVSVVAGGTEWYKAASTDISFVVFKHASMIKSLVISPDSISAGDNVTISVKMDSVNGFRLNSTDINVEVGGKNYTVPIDENGEGSLTLSLPAGNYSVAASFAGNDYYNESLPAYGGFSVAGKNNTFIIVSVNDTTVYDEVFIRIALQSDAAGEVEVYLNGKFYGNVTIIDGAADLPIQYLQPGNYTVNAVFKGDEKYSQTSNSSNFTVSKINTAITHIFNPDTGIIEFSFDNIAGNIVVNLGGEYYILNVNTTGSINLSYLSPAVYSCQVSYDGDINHNPFFEEFNVEVTKGTAQISAVADNIRYGETQNITVSVPGDATGSVNFIVSTGGEIVSNQSSPINQGVARLTIASLKIGTYEVSAQINDPKYYKTQYSMKFSVMPKISIPPVVKITREGEITVELSNASGRVKLIIDNQEYLIQKIKDNKVVFIVDTEDFDTGNHTVTFQYVEGSSFDENVFSYWDEKTGQFRPIEYVLQILPMEVAPDSKSNNKEEFYEVCLRDENGDVAYDAEGTIEFFVNGVRVAVVEVVDGIAKLDISQYKNGNYVIGWKYSGDGKYNQFSGGLVLNINRKIIAGDFTAVYASGKTYSVTVYGSNGKAAVGSKVTFSINNKVYGSAVTNSNGIASIIVSQVPGTYKITINALGVSVTKKLTIGHVLSLQTVKVKRSAKKLVIKATLKKVNSKFLKGKKITFRFNGKKYTAKTDKKGVAKVTIKANVLKKLKAGRKVKYQATYLKDTVKKTVKVKK